MSSRLVPVTEESLEASVKRILERKKIPVLIRNKLSMLKVNLKSNMFILEANESDQFCKYLNLFNEAFIQPEYKNVFARHHFLTISNYELPLRERMGILFLDHESPPGVLDVTITQEVTFG
eukprot:TRINITY_DN5662_c4_g1_i1.p1 TRINITY_DN5662_c4_g1~~TRINITY_DN5662_c4_g1_i1.p1  ORF type:complete len:121 (+),score=1.85 TRINITY_DN5662_c4_g1_i1:47-409(+)